MGAGPALQRLAACLLFALAACAGRGPAGREAADALSEHHRAGRLQEYQALLRDLLKGHLATAVEVFTILLRDPGFAPRASLIAEAERAGLEELGPALVPLLDDPDEAVRLWSAAALGTFGDPEAVPALQARSKREAEPYAAFEMRAALARLGLPYLGYYAAGLKDRDPQRRYVCLVTLGRLRDPRSVPFLLELLDSRETWEPWYAATALTRVTGIEHVVTTRVETRPDGSTQTTGQRRPLEDFRRDCLAWVERHAEIVRRPVEASVEKWAFTPEPEIPGFGVSFALDPDAVARLYDAARIPYARHRGEEGVENGHPVRSPDRISADRSLWAGLNEWLAYIHYGFEDGKLSEIAFRLNRPEKGALDLLKTRLDLREKGVGTWEGLGGTVVLSRGDSNAEWEGFSLALRFLP